MFALWPENLTYVKFVYYCEDILPHPRHLSEFKYKEGEGVLVTRPYFDVGIVDKHYTPFFRQWTFWNVDMRRIPCALKCEYSDLQRLYVYRMQHNVLARGLGYGVAALVILQFAVLAAAVVTSILLPLGTEEQGSLSNPNHRTGNILASIWKTVPTSLWSDCASDWMHLLLLVLNGSAMMEGVGHSDYFRWRSMVLYNTAVSYSWLTLLAVLSSFLH